MHHFLFISIRYIWRNHKPHSIFFSCDQAALWMVQSVRPSVCLSVRLSVTPFWLCSHHRIIMKFSGVIINDKSNIHAKDQGQRSKVKVTEVNTQLNHFWTVTPVWIHIWWWNDAYSLMRLPYCFSRSSVKFQGHTALKSVKFDPDWVFPDCNSSLFTNGYEMMHKAWSSIEEVPYCFWNSSVKFQGHMALKSMEFDPDWAFPDCNSSLNSPMATKWCTKLEVA